MEKQPHKIIFNKNKYFPVPSGRYRLRVNDVWREERTNYGWHYVYISTYEILDGEHAGITLYEFINEHGEYGKTCKMWERVEVLLGQEPPEIKNFDPKMLIGKECFGYIELELGVKPINRITKLEPLNA